MYEPLFSKLVEIEYADTTGNRKDYQRLELKYLMAMAFLPTITLSRLGPPGVPIVGAGLMVGPLRAFRMLVHSK
jgi:hypothetical protein